MQQKRIILVEDDAAVSDVLQIVLNSNPYYVSAFNSAEECLSHPEIHADVYLIDYSLPGINGIELCNKLKVEDATKNIPVVLISADLFIRRKAKDCGATAVIDKPFSRIDLLSAIEEAIKGSSFKE